MAEENRPKTLAEHREYLHEIVKLQLFFVHLWLAKHPEEDFAQVMRRRVDIYRATDANPGSFSPRVRRLDEAPWTDLVAAAREVYCRRRDDREAFEREAFGIFRPSIDRRCEFDYGERRPAGIFQCGCFTPGEAPEADGRLMFHIANTLSPRSFLADPAYFVRCFRALLDVAERIYGVKELTTRSWLNSYPRWLAYFPEEWRRNLSEPNRDIQWHAGFWGQFVTARGTFHRRRAEMFRRSGEFPYLPRASFVSIEAMRQQLHRMSTGETAS